MRNIAFVLAPRYGGLNFCGSHLGNGFVTMRPVRKRRADGIDAADREEALIVQQDGALANLISLTSITQK